MRTLTTVAGAVLACLCLLPGATLAGKPKAPTEPAPQPFGLVLGVTTEADAARLCQAEQGKATARGNVDARPATKTDNDPEGLPNPRAVLVEVAGLPTPGVESTRLGFFDDRLYLIRYRFAVQHDARALMEQLKAKYGEPVESTGIVHSYEWRFVDVTLTFRDELVGADTLTFVHDKLQQAVADSSTALWRERIGQKADSQRGF